MVYHLLVAHRMGSQGGDSNSIAGSQAITQNPLARQGSFYSLTIDEVQSQLGDLGKPFSSMNLDELLKTVWTAEANNQATGGLNSGPAEHQPGPSAPLNRQSSVALSLDLSKKTVDEVWQDIQQGQEGNNNLDRNATLGAMSFEDFLVKAGVVAAESSPGKKDLGPEAGPGESTGVPQQGQWMNFPEFIPGRPLMGSENQSDTRVRVAPGDDIVERTVERRQKRMIKNRESAARSRARKEAYTHELRNKVSRLEEENERLKRQKDWEMVLRNSPPPEPKYQLRRTSSTPV